MSRAAERQLLQQAGAIAGMWRAACARQRDTWACASLAELLLAQGRLFTPAPRPPRFSAGVPGTCFATASRMADEHPDLLYAEGMVLADGLPFAFDHAWCVSAASDHVIDSTLPDGAGLAYLGIVLTDDYRREQQALRGVDAVITGGGINLADNADALREGLPDYAWLPVGGRCPPSYKGQKNHEVGGTGLGVSWCGSLATAAARAAGSSAWTRSTSWPAPCRAQGAVATVHRSHQHCSPTPASVGVALDR